MWDIQKSWFDWQMVVWVVFAYMAAKELKSNWRQIFDQDLTVYDRHALQKINLFFLIPIVVFLHELGHAVATIWAGGQVGEFHYAVWWGYVEPIGHFTDVQNLIIYLAGSCVQIVAGFIALIFALFVTSPPIVALLVYGGLYAIGGTVIVYALLSFVGMYGDWIAIYNSPAVELVNIVRVVHVLLVILLAYLCYGQKPRLWFSAKTRPKWYGDYKRALERVKSDPTAINYLSLAWTYYLVGLDKMAFKTLNIAGEKDPALLDRFILEGCLKQGKGDLDGAIQSFETISDSPNADPLLKCRALMSVGHCLLSQSESKNKSNTEPDSNQFGHVLAAYEQARIVSPTTADPRFYKATVLNKVGLHKEAYQELKELQGLNWLDPALSELFSQEIQVARKTDKSLQ